VAAVLAARASSPSFLLTTTTSASSMIPRLMPWSSSPAPGAMTRRKRSTMPATATSDWPTPTVSTITTSKPAASHRSIASRVRRRPPPGGGAGGGGAGGGGGHERGARAGELPHRSLVAEDRPAGARARRVDGEDGDAMALLDEPEAECLDERRLPRAGRARDADANRVTGAWEQLREQLGRLVAMVGPRRLDRRDGPRQRAPVPVADLLSELAHPERRCRRSSRISAAARGMLVPGP